MSEFCLQWIFIAVILLLIFPGFALAEWEYKIISSDDAIIDLDNTTAFIDNTLHEIRLPQTFGKSVAIYNEGDGADFDFVVLTSTGFKHYNFDGTKIVEITTMSKDGLSNPLAVCTSTYPDKVVMDRVTGEMTHYSFIDSEMSRNPFLTVTGLANVINIGCRDMDKAVLTTDKTIRYYGFAGTEMVEIPNLSITTGLTNPLNFALFNEEYNTVVIDGSQVKYYKNNVENPAMRVTGFINPKSISAGEEGHFAIIDGTQSKHYQLDENGFVYNEALSILSGLNSPTCIALRKNSYDRLIVDGDKIKYFMWDGSVLRHNPALSVTIAGLKSDGSFIPSAAIQSDAFVPLDKVISARVRAYCETPKNTAITWFLTVDGANWKESWRIRGESDEESVLELLDDNNWVALGDKALSDPTSNEMQLWTGFESSGNQVKWRAELTTADVLKTPKIKAQNPGINPAVVLDVNNRPFPPIINDDFPPGICCKTATPVLKWRFLDPDRNDYQTDYRIKIDTVTGIKVVNTEIDGFPGYYDPFKSEFQVPPEVFFNSGEHQFYYRVKTCDKGGLWSEYSDPKFLCVNAFERPRIQELSFAPQSYINYLAGLTPPQGLPDPLDPTTYIEIIPGMQKEKLPKTKAGGKVTLLVNGIGLEMDKINLIFPYLTKEATIEADHPVELEKVGNKNRKIRISFWADPQLEICPTGTLVKGTFRGLCSVFVNNETKMLLDLEKDEKFADGVVVTEGTVLSDWFVVLQGRSSRE